MKIEEIREIFKNSKQVCIDKNGQCPVDGLYYGDMFDIIITMKNNIKISILCDETIIIDCSRSHPNAEIGIDNTLIEPIKEIEKIEINWR